MNSLGRTIEENEVVVLRKDLFKPEFQEQKERAVRVIGGFGMNDFTTGSAIYVEYLSDGEKVRQEGHQIDPEETAQYQAEHGKFGEKS